MRPENPCRTCEHHTADCHAICEAYLTWSSARRAAREERWRQDRGARDARSRFIEQRIRQRKRRERG